MIQHYSIASTENDGNISVKSYTNVCTSDREREREKQIELLIITLYPTRGSKNPKYITNKIVLLY